VLVEKHISGPRPFLPPSVDAHAQLVKNIFLIEKTSAIQIADLS